MEERYQLLRLESKESEQVDDTKWKTIDSKDCCCHVAYAPSSSTYHHHYARTGISYQITSDVTPGTQQFEHSLPQIFTCSKVVVPNWLDSTVTFMGGRSCFLLSLELISVSAMSLFSILRSPKFLDRDPLFFFLKNYRISHFSNLVNDEIMRWWTTGDKCNCRKCVCVCVRVKLKFLLEWSTKNAA